MIDKLKLNSFRTFGKKCLANEQISQKGIDNLVWQITDDSQTSPHQTFLVHDISFEENSSKRFTDNLGKLHSLLNISETVNVFCLESFYQVLN